MSPCLSHEVESSFTASCHVSFYTSACIAFPAVLDIAFAVLNISSASFASFRCVPALRCTNLILFEFVVLDKLCKPILKLRRTSVLSLPAMGLGRTVTENIKSLPM
jgi:hypothetical protein